MRGVPGLRRSLVLSAVVNTDTVLRGEKGSLSAADFGVQAAKEASRRTSARCSVYSLIIGSGAVGVWMPGFGMNSRDKDSFSKHGYGILKV